MFVRLAKVKDCQEIFDLFKDGDSGMTTLPKSKDEVLERISWSKKSLNKKTKKPDKDSYLFVLKIHVQCVFPYLNPLWPP